LISAADFSAFADLTGTALETIAAVLTVLDTTDDALVTTAEVFADTPGTDEALFPMGATGAPDDDEITEAGLSVFFV
jgi:hypothetical protein